MELFFLRASPPHCPPEFECIIESRWQDFASDPNKLRAVIIALPWEEGWLDNHVIAGQLFNSERFSITKVKPDTNQRILLVIAN